MKNRATMVKIEAAIKPVVSPGVEKLRSPTARAEMKTESSIHLRTEKRKREKRYRERS